jgi:hypothetical protein
MRLRRQILLTVVILAATGWSQSGRKSPTKQDEWDEAYRLASVARSDRPKDGFVPSSEAAIQIAEAIASALYGERTALDERPFRARLRAGVWTVIGTLNPPRAYGGVAIIQINKADGRVLFAHHTQ